MNVFMYFVLFGEWKSLESHSYKGGGDFFISPRGRYVLKSAKVTRVVNRSRQLPCNFSTFFRFLEGKFLGKSLAESEQSYRIQPEKIFKITDHVSESAIAKYHRLYTQGAAAAQTQGIFPPHPVFFTSLSVKNRRLEKTAPPQQLNERGRIFWDIL